METQFDDLSIPNIDTEYYCSPITKATGFTHLMKLVLMVNKCPEVIALIKEIIKDANVVNAQNSKGWTASMIACRNSNTYSNNLVVEMLINANADINQKNDRGNTCHNLSKFIFWYG